MTKLKVRKNDIRYKTEFYKISNFIKKDTKSQQLLRKIIKLADAQHRLHYIEVEKSDKFVAEVDEKKYLHTLKGNFKFNQKSFDLFVKGITNIKDEKKELSKYSKSIKNELVKLQKSIPFNKKIIAIIQKERDLTKIIRQINLLIAEDLIKNRHALKIELNEIVAVNLSKNSIFVKQLNDLYEKTIKQTLSQMKVKEINHKQDFNYEKQTFDFDDMKILSYRHIDRKVDIYKLSELIAYVLIQSINEEETYQTFYIEFPIKNTIVAIDKFDRVLNNRVNEKYINQLKAKLEKEFKK